MLSARIPVLIVSLAAAAFSVAAPVQWTTASGGNGHYYEAVLSSTTYDDAKTAALGMSYLGMSGHLAQWEDADTVNAGKTELDFLNGTFGPLLTPTPAALWLGGESNSVNDPFVYSTGGLADVSHFSIDHMEGNVREGLLMGNLGGGVGDGDYAASNPVYSANGPLAIGFVVEYQPVPEPASLAVLGLGGIAVLRRRRRG